MYSTNSFALKIYENGCDWIIPWLGIDPGSDDNNIWLTLMLDTVKFFFDPNSYWFQITILFLTTVIAFLLGVYVRRRTVIGLLRQKEEWIDKEKMLLNQLWGALEEKLENKTMLHESSSSLNQLKNTAEDNQQRSERETMQSRLLGLERNIKLLQSERDMLEEKLRDCISTFASLRKSLCKNEGKGESVEVTTCMEKVKSLQNLMKKLIDSHRQEHNSFVAMLDKQSFDQ